MPPTAITVYDGTGPAALAGINEYSVLSIPAFWSGVRFLSETLASLPKAVYQRDGNSRTPMTHQQNRLLSRQANRFNTPFTVFETWHAHAVIHGNGYLFIDRDQATAKPVGYYNLNPEIVVPFRYDGQQWYMVRNGTMKDGRPANLILPAADILHLAGLGFDGMLGYPVISLMAESLELARNGQRFASRYLKKGTQIQGSIEIPAQATKEQIDAIINRLSQSHNGIDSNYTFTVLTGGAKLNNGTIPPEQSQLLQSRQFSVLDMCRILRVPPHIVYDLSRATWANIESMGIEVVKYSLYPWVQKAEQELSLKLLTAEEQDNGLFIRYAVDNLMRGDAATQTSTTLSLVNGGIITANEGRANLDLPPSTDPTADKLRVPVNFPIASAPDAKPIEPTKPQNPPKSPDVPDTAGEEQDFAASHVTADTFAPLINDAVTRIETKTTKAFSNHANRPDATVWANVFAEEQAKFVRDAFTPVARVMFAATHQKMDVEKIADRYATTIRAKAAGETVKSLSDIVTECRSKE